MARIKAVGLICIYVQFGKGLGIEELIKVHAKGDIGLTFLNVCSLGNRVPSEVTTEAYWIYVLEVTLKISLTLSRTK